MSEPDGTKKTFRLELPLPEVTGREAIVAVLAALVDLFLTMPDLPGAVEPQLRQLRSSMHPNGDPGQVMQDALNLSAICETAKRNLGR